MLRNTVGVGGCQISLKKVMKMHGSTLLALRGVGGFTSKFQTKGVT